MNGEAPEKATQLQLDKPVAVKVMARELASNQEALERFRRKARVTSGLGHPRIVQVFVFSATPTDEPLLVMKLLEGEDLDHRRVGRLPAKDVVHIVTQVASALAATHAKGIVHRDLKPGNIYLLEVAGETDFVKVVDLGISKIRSAMTKLTRTASVIGTPNCMSPEQTKVKVSKSKRLTGDGHRPSSACRWMRWTQHSLHLATAALAEARALVTYDRQMHAVASALEAFDVLPPKLPKA